jgi:hypothetical protein
MLTTLAVSLITLSPILAVVALLETAGWWQRRQDGAVARQIALTDAIASELGAVVAPVVRRPLRGPWLIEIAVPFARPATVSTILAIAHRLLAFGDRMSPGDYRIVLTPQEEPRRTRAPRAGRSALVEARSC